MSRAAVAFSGLLAALVRIWILLRRELRFRRQVLVADDVGGEPLAATVRPELGVEPVSSVDRDHDRAGPPVRVDRVEGVEQGVEVGHGAS